MVDTGRQQPGETDWYPMLTLKFERGGTALTGDFDTGAVFTCISYEWLLEHKIVEPISAFRLAALRAKTFRFAYVELRASLVSGDSITPPATFTVGAVLDFAQSPFARPDRDRVALIGRDILKNFNATVELDATGRETRVILQNWNTFEIEVARLYRALGLKAQKNYNLGGNQVDIFLTELTASGKELRTIVECKFHRNPVGIQYVRDLAAVLEFAKSTKLADHAVLVSSSGFTKDAHLVAQASGVELLEIEELMRRVKQLAPSEVQPRPEPEPKTKTPKQRTAFVIMPFKDEYRDVYMLGIRGTLADLGYACTRADELEFSGRIMDQIFDMIRMSDLVVAEVSEHNPNVYYELGICHALGKNVVMCTRSAASIPFDTREFNHVLYSDIVDLRERLSARVGTLPIPDIQEGS